MEERRRKGDPLRRHRLLASVLLSWAAFLLFIRPSLFQVSFQPVLILPRRPFPSRSSTAIDRAKLSATQTDEQILFPDHVLLLLRCPSRFPEMDSKSEPTFCVYRNQNSSMNRISLPPISSDSDSRFRLIRCPLHPTNFSGSSISFESKGNLQLASAPSPSSPSSLCSWDSIVYESLLDSDTVILFVKGLNFKPGRIADPIRLRCMFRIGSSLLATTAAISAAQEIVRCPFPSIFERRPPKRLRVSLTATDEPVSIPSVATLQPLRRPYVSGKRRKKKYRVCLCTMVWNQAHFLKEWISYHSWLGVQRWFVYDNNSDDDIVDVIRQLVDSGLQVTRHVWPWIKTQEAGFSHCALVARTECEWVAFMDVDEFLYFKPSIVARFWKKSKPLLHALVSNFTSTRVAEIRIDCYSFGPSGHRTLPPRGVMAGYTCRLTSPERHKSMVRPDSLDGTLLNVVHHFYLKPGFEYVNLPKSVVVINHYKYQAWEVFKTKFYRRVATYVADWHENQNQGSKDRAPGLGTEAVEPIHWHLRFCEVNDTGLRDFIHVHFQHKGLFPWEKM